mmetsp:Transcript_8202/g.26013  ORF Transcript_8202/g.26013 Transcript_8202/m.26013 type:complete len:212 (-) Transcript_8202:49-684(-)
MGAAAAHRGLRARLPGRRGLGDPSRARVPALSQRSPVDAVLALLLDLVPMEVWRPRRGDRAARPAGAARRPRFRPRYGRATRDPRPLAIRMEPGVVEGPILPHARHHAHPPAAQRHAHRDENDPGGAAQRARASARAAADAAERGRDGGTRAGALLQQLPRVHLRPRLRRRRLRAAVLARLGQVPDLALRWRARAVWPYRKTPPAAYRGAG